MNQPEAAAPPEVLHPGARLCRARQALGIGRSDVAASLHLEEEVSTVPVFHAFATSLIFNSAKMAS